MLKTKRNQTIQVQQDIWTFLNKDGVKGTIRGSKFDSVLKNVIKTTKTKAKAFRRVGN